MPGDAIGLNGILYRLARGKDDKPIYVRRPVPFFPEQQAPSDVTEANFPPEARQPYSFRDLSGGAGQFETPARGDNTRYWRIGDVEGEGVNTVLTPFGPVLLAAQLNTQDVTPTGTSNFLGSLWKGGSNNAAFAVGRYVNTWDGVTFTQVGDLGANNAPTDALIPFRGKLASDAWYAPLGYSTTAKVSTDSGVTWNPLTTTGGINQIQSLCLLDGEVLCLIPSQAGYGNAAVCAFNDGGAAPTLYGLIDPIGDPSISASRIMAFAGRVIVLKDGEGLFLLTRDKRQLQQELFPALRGAKLYYNGARVWREYLWLPTDRGLFAISPSFQLRDAGPEKQDQSNTMGARGYVTALDGDAHHLYAVRYGGDSSTPSFLYVAQVTAGLFGQFDIVWHQFLQLANGAQCLRVDTLSPGGNGPKLLFDRQGSDGTFKLYFLRLPARGRDPRGDPNYQYCGGGTLYFSRLTARFPFAQKTFFGIQPLVPPLTLKQDGQTTTSALSVTQKYKLDTTALTSVGPHYGYTAGATQITGTGSRDDVLLRGKGLDSAVRLASTDNTATPQVAAVTPDYDVEPNALWQHEGTLQVGPGSLSAAGVTGANDPMTPGQAMKTLQNLVGAGPITLVDQWDNSYTVTIPLTGMTFRSGGGRNLGDNIDPPILIDFRAIEQKGRVSGTYNALTSYTYGQLPNVAPSYSALANV